MQFSTFQKNLDNWQGASLIFGVLEEEIASQLENIKFVVDPKLLLKKVTQKKFKGEKGKTLSFEFLDQKLETLFIVGLGKSKDLNKSDIENSIGNLVRKTVDKNEKMSILLPWEFINSQLEINQLAESVRLSAYKDNRFNKKKDEKKVLKEIEFLNLKKFENISFEETAQICEGVELARRLVAAPPNSLTPQEMSIQASQIAKDHGLEVKILEAKDSQIEMMKYDMGGSAAVLGAAKALGAIKPKGLEIHFIVASCENMINGSAVHPGDVVKASNGKTIEINNTDAEGRLTLADALTYASNLKPDSIIDLATLTGAIVVALGNDVAGFWSNNDDLANDLKAASAQSGEELWQMPLQKSYKEGLKSHIADMKNTGPRAGGSITAALFLEEFFDKEIKWAHIDIAGTCWTDKNKGINPSGATGFGVKTLVQWIKNK